MDSSEHGDKISVSANTKITVLQKGNTFQKNILYSGLMDV